MRQDSFIHALLPAGLGDALFQEVLGQLEAAGFVLKACTLIVATLVRSSGRTPPSARRRTAPRAVRPTTRTPTGRGTGGGAVCSSATRPISPPVTDRI
jgi:hypothetical protein